MAREIIYNRMRRLYPNMICIHKLDDDTYEVLLDSGRLLTLSPVYFDVDDFHRWVNNRE
jgi:predicted ribosome-associated RNA-binding protein Tma20